MPSFHLTSHFHRSILEISKEGTELDYTFLLDLAIILFFTKIFGIIMKRIGLPEVVGALLAGLLIGPCLLGIVKESSTLNIFAEIGVLLIMFTAGMETNIKQIKSTGFASIVITALGVIVPMGIGFVVACLFNGGFATSKDQMMTNLFYGVILTATSVSITVATLKEMGKLSSKMGTAIVSAAILDDIIVLIVLSIVIGLKNQSANVGRILLNTSLYFVLAIIVGIILYYIFKKLEKYYPHNRRMPIFSLVICFLFAYAAEAIFGIANITGAFMAGIIFSTMKSRDYIGHRIDIGAYLVFAPVFFASIGINSAIPCINKNIVFFGITMVIIALLTKLIGCGLGARLCKFSKRDSVLVGLGMMTRAEVLLIAVQRGITNNFISSDFMPFALAIVILSSLITPILLKVIIKKYPDQPIDCLN